MAREAIALDIAAIEASLRIPQAGTSAVVPSWLRHSHEQPMEFWRSLMAWVTGTSARAPKSEPLRRYDLFFDLITRHISPDVSAMSWLKGDGQVGGISYEEVATRAVERAAGWRLLGVEPGTIVAIVRSTGPEMLISIATALYLGAPFCLIPPHGTRFVTSRLEASGAAFVDADAFQQTFLDDLELPRLPERSPNAAALEIDRSMSFAVGTPAAYLFDPSSATPEVPTPVSADALYLCSLRDGVLAYSLRRGNALAAPGFPQLFSMPSMLFAALHCGGTYHHVTPDDVRRDPMALVARPVKAMGVGTWLRDHLRGAPQRVVGEGNRAWGSWFRDPVESLDLLSWQAFVDANGLGETPAFNVRVDSALGGCTLFSPRRPGTAHFDVLPSAGVPHRTHHFVGHGTEVVGSQGLFAVCLPGDAVDTYRSTPWIAAPARGSYIYGGSIVEGSRGMTTLRADLEYALAGVAGLEGSAVVMAPSLGDTRQRSVGLLFTGATHVADPGAVIAEAKRAMAAAVGDVHMPDRVEHYALFPRRTEEGEIDIDWCRDQYLTGGLGRRAGDELQTMLTVLTERNQAAAHVSPPPVPEGDS